MKPGRDWATPCVQRTASRYPLHEADEINKYKVPLLCISWPGVLERPVSWRTLVSFPRIP